MLVVLRQSTTLRQASGPGIRGVVRPCGSGLRNETQMVREVLERGSNGDPSRSSFVTVWPTLRSHRRRILAEVEDYRVVRTQTEVGDDKAAVGVDIDRVPHVMQVGDLLKVACEEARLSKEVDADSVRIPAASDIERNALIAVADGCPALIRDHQGQQPRQIHVHEPTLARALARPAPQRDAGLPLGARRSALIDALAPGATSGHSAAVPSDVWREVTKDLLLVGLHVFARQLERAATYTQYVSTAVDWGVTSWSVHQSGAR